MLVPLNWSDNITTVLNRPEAEYVRFGLCEKAKRVVKVQSASYDYITFGLNHWFTLVKPL
jgi:hypothetical protein